MLCSDRRFASAQTWPPRSTSWSEWHCSSTKLSTVTTQKEKAIQNTLVLDLRLTDPKAFRELLWMDESTFEKFLGHARLLIEKEDTNMRKSIKPDTRLELTLRFLATGGFSFLHCDNHAQQPYSSRICRRQLDNTDHICPPSYYGRRISIGVTILTFFPR